MKKQIMTLSASAILAAATFVGAAPNVVTVDGVGGAAVTDPGGEFNTSYASVSAAMTAINADATLEGVTVTITVAGPISEPAGILINTNQAVTINGLSGGSHLAITPSGIGISSASAAMVIALESGRTVTLNDLILTPSLAAPAGAVNSRALQVYTSTAVAPAAVQTLNLNRVYFTALTKPGNQPVLNPFAHAASPDTIAARNAQLASFDGGGANNAIELRYNGSAASGAKAFFNLTNVVVSHVIGTGAKAGGIVISRSRDFDLNINEGCVFSYNSGSGIRASGTLQGGTTAINVAGTPTNPVFFLYNGWQEDTANTARNEGIQNDGSTISINNAYFIGNFQEAIDKVGAGALTISNSFFAKNQKDLDTTNGTAPNVATAANLKLSGTAAYSLTNVTIYDNLGGANANGINWSGGTGSSLTMNNLVLAGAGDGNLIGGANAVTLTDNNAAVVTAGADALAGFTLGASVTRTSTFPVSADPQFAITNFVPTFAGLGVKPTGLDNYLRVQNSAAYGNTRAGGTGEITVTGANPNFGAMAANTAPTDITYTPVSPSLAENSALSTLVATLSTTDADAGDAFVYTLIAGTGDTNNALFKIVGNELRTNGALDFETLGSPLSVLVQSQDMAGAGLTYSEAISITLTNVNEAPTAITPTPGTPTVAENAATGTSVATLAATDPDAGDTFVYTLVAGTGDTNNGLFQIVGNDLQVLGALDFETLGASLTVRVQVQDQGGTGLTFATAIPVTLTDVLTEIDVAPLAKNFGAVTIGSTPTDTITITNTSSEPLTVSSLGFTGADAAVYSLVSPPTLPATVLNGSPLVLTVQFAPVAALAYNDATLVITSNDADEGTVNVDLDGSGVSSVNEWNLLND